LEIDFFSFIIIKKHSLCPVSRYDRVGMFESVVVIVFQSVFHSEIHQNNIFLFLKNYF
jgi:hypothetical protein